MPLAHEPLAFVDFAVRVEVAPDTVSQVLLYFSGVLSFAPPPTLLLTAGLEQPEEVLVRAPVVEALAVEHVIVVVAVVVFFVLEDLEGQSAPSPVFELAVVDVPVYPDSWVAEFPCDQKSLLQAVLQL